MKVIVFFTILLLSSPGFSKNQEKDNLDTYNVKLGCMGCHQGSSIDSEENVLEEDPPLKSQDEKNLQTQKK
jgi:hypothetical protein